MLARKVFFSGLVMSLFVALYGCSSNKPKPTPSTLRTISINSNVGISEKPEFKEGGEGITWLLKQTGLKLEDRADTLKSLMIKQQIDLGQLVSKSFKEQLSESKSPIQIVDSNSEADLQFNIQAYGLKFALEGRKIPTITLQIVLTNKSGATIWDNSESVDNIDEFRDGISTHYWLDYQEIPPLLEQDFKAVINLAIKRQIEELKKDYFSGEIGN